jgi:DNA polymerase-1
MQNIPRESSIRKLFVPSKHDHVFVQTDYSQAELRVLSYLAKDTYFRDIFNDGTIDVFDDLTPILYPHADRSQMTKEEWKELRIRVKAYVYGVSYGRSEFSIASEFDISVREARAGMERFFSVIPEIVDFRNNTRQRVLEGGDLVTPWGRRRRYALITDENKDAIMNEALAFMPQSTASDMCVQALTWTRPQLKGLGWIRNIVHDSLLVECHEEDAEEVTAIIEKNMIDSAKTIVGDYVKFAVESTVGKSWGDV